LTLHFTPLAIVITILATAYAAFLSQMALAVFNDGVRPFILDFRRGELSRAKMIAIAFSLSTGFFFGFGVPIALASGVLNPWVLFLPTDVLGIFSPNKWLALLLGALWGAIVVFGLNAATTIANSLPVNVPQAMGQMATPILFLFAFFPAIAITMQFGRLQGVGAFVISAFAMLITVKWLPQVFPGSMALATGMIMLIIFALVGEVNSKKEARAEATSTSDATEVSTDENEATSLFSENAARLRKHAPYFIIMGFLIGVLANTHMFGGGEATSFILAKGQYVNATQIDFYRALGFIPLIVTTSVASGAFQIVGFMLTCPIAYLLPNPILAGIVGSVLFGIEVLVLIYVVRGLSALRILSDVSDNIRYAINLTLEVAILFGSITAGNAMASGVGIALVGGIYILNEVSGRPVVRMAAGPMGVILSGIFLNVFAYIHLFTPITIK